ncbi:MAG TPA: hypothetical protein VEU08_10075 [Vicinamibacterales bacterium]|nr:hypothetical protein [Vicinamibacterales bacterium]
MRRAAIVLAAVLSSGCLVLSLQPAYDDQSVAFDESLLGTWTDAEDQLQATVERGEWRSYRITYVDHSTTKTFQGNLTRIGATLYLDLTESRGEDPGPYLIPVHGLYRLEINGNTLTAARLDYGWFTRAMQQKTLARLNVSFDDRRNAVIAATTADLRRWLAKPPAGADVLAAPMTFERVP